jgi:hypothetical protein
LAANAPLSLSNAKASAVLKESLLGPIDVSISIEEEAAVVDAAVGELAAPFFESLLRELLAWRLRGEPPGLDLGGALD